MQPMLRKSEICFMKKINWNLKLAAVRFLGTYIWCHNWEFAYKLDMPYPMMLLEHQSCDSIISTSVLFWSTCYWWINGNKFKCDVFASAFSVHRLTLHVGPNEYRWVKFSLMSVRWTLSWCGEVTEFPKELCQNESPTNLAGSCECHFL